MIVMEKIKANTMPITDTTVIFIGGVFIIKNSSICKENPILKSTPRIIPPKIDTISLIII